MDQKHIRNFSIIAHIDHGKSTLADRILEITDTVEQREMKEQLLDTMDLERERGITIKARAVSVIYKADDGETYVFNLIDTPGHVDFNYEVSRSLNACEGAILVVDATQGIEAQTLANTYLAIEQDLELVPVINKIDLPSAHPDEVKEEIETVIGIPADEAPLISAKMGINIKEVMEQVVKNVPAPKGDPDAPLKALIFDSYYDAYKGVIVYVRIKDGTLRPGDRIKMMATGAEFDVVDVGYMGAKALENAKELRAGEVGYIAASIKSIGDTKVGDTVTLVSNPAKEALAGYRNVNPMVYSGIYPADGAKYGDLRDALEKLQLNDASLTFEPETSIALGFGFRCGFLGLLHMEIVQERLDREFDMNVITTVPNVSYNIYDKQGHMTEVHNPGSMPDPTLIDRIEEPYIRASVITATDYIGPIMTLCLGKRGELVKQEYISGNRVEIYYDMPLGEIVIDFYDKLKSISKGYASFDYHANGFRPSKLVKLDILLNGEPVDALSTLTHFDNAYELGRRMCEKLKDLIPRQQFDIAIQAAIGAKIISRETIKAVRKDVTAKCYGGDVSRKRKLLEKQKRGKKRMKQIGNVEVPQKAFLAVLKLD